MNPKLSAACMLLAYAVLPAQTTPYNGTPAEIPGNLASQNFDEGGSGVAYSINGEYTRNGNYTDFRPSETVSLDNDDNTIQVGWFHAGSWIKYSYIVSASGTYDVYVTYRCGSFDTPRDVTLDFGRPEVTPVDFPYQMNDINWSTIPQGERAIAAQDLALDMGPGVLTIKNTGGSDINIIGLDFQQKTVGIHPKPAGKVQRNLAVPVYSGHFIRTTFPFHSAYNAFMRVDISGRISPPGRAAR